VHLRVLSIPAGNRGAAPAGVLQMAVNLQFLDVVPDYPGTILVVLGHGGHAAFRAGGWVMTGRALAPLSG